LLTFVSQVFSASSEYALRFVKAGKKVYMPNAVLPGSKLVVSYSTKFYKFVPEGAPNFVAPGVVIEPKWEDYVAGKDAALEWVLAH